MREQDIEVCADDEVREGDAVKARSARLFAARALSGALKANRVLTWLYLGRCGLGDAGAAEVAAAVGVNKVLTVLILDDNGIGVRGARGLSMAMRANSTLATLGLARNGRIAGRNGSGEGVRLLCTMLHTNTGLVTLNLEGIKLSEEGHELVDRARRVNPSVTVLQ